MDKCKLCLTTTNQLRKSHAIPRAIFRKLLDEKGKYIQHKIDEDSVHTGQDQGAVIMLCGECENLINNQFEDYSLRILNDHYSEADGNGVRLCDVNLHKINMYCLSVFWRSMVSESNLYHAIPNVPEVTEWYRKYILHNTPVPRTEFAVFIYRLDGRRLGLDGDGMRGTLLNPTSTRSTLGSVVRFVYSGYLFEKYPFWYSRLNKKSEDGLVRKNKRYMRIPDLDVTSQDWFITAYNKTVRKLQNS